MNAQPVSSSARRSGWELRDVLKECRGALIVMAVTSGVMNLLMLTGPVFMLQVYDRVLPSRSIPSLIGLAMLAFVLFIFLGGLDLLRGRVLSRIGRYVDERLRRRVFICALQKGVATRQPAERLRVVRDLDQIRAFVGSPGLTAFFDLPWLPLFVGLCYLFHPWIGFAVVIGALVLAGLTVMTEMLTRRSTADIVRLSQSRMAMGDAAIRNAGLVQALGMQQRFAERWHDASETYISGQQYNADIAGSLGGITRMFRMMLQAAVLGVGAYLVVVEQATGGVMLAATILSIRALAPVELAIANWQTFLRARQSWRNLSEMLATHPVAQDRTPLAAPAREVSVTALSVVPPGGVVPTIHDISFTVRAGSALGVIGPSGSGKSTLAHALVGAWPSARGVIRLDGATLDQWESDRLGASIGFLPQDAPLFEGTVAQNIERFSSPSDPEKLMAAARQAGVHDLILGMPNGYETQVGEDGSSLSGGQRQRIALARALYGDPFLLVLDEPNSNLDADGDVALTNAIRSARGRGAIVLVIAHRPSALAAVDQVLVLNEGRMRSLGPIEKVLGVAQAQKPAAPADARRRTVRAAARPQERPHVVAAE